jgi:predicted phosphoribosyltransferase
MKFSDRADAASKLLKKIRFDPLVKKNLKNIVIISLLRGGAVIGNYLSKKLKAPHLPLVVAKIPAPQNPELAIGALCFDISYLERRIVEQLNLTKRERADQIKIAREKFNSYILRFGIKENIYEKLKNKIIILVDDGVATGASVKAALLYLRTKDPAKIILAVPVGPIDFEIGGIDKVLILYKDPNFSAVSQFYEKFPQIEDDEVRRLIR